MLKNALIFLCVFIMIIENANAINQTDIPEEFTAEEVNKYLEKYGVKVAKLTDKIVLNSLLDNAGVFYTYSTIRSYINLYELSHTETSRAEYFHLSLQIHAKSMSTLSTIMMRNTLNVSASTLFFPLMNTFFNGIALTESIIHAIASDLDKQFLFNQLIYYRKMIDYNISTDPYMDGYTNDEGYLLSPIGHSHAPLDREKLNSSFVKNWVLSNYEMIKNFKELEIDAKKNAQKLSEYLIWRTNQIEKYKYGQLTNVLVNTDNSIIVSNLGRDTLYNFELTDNFWGIPTKRSAKTTLLPHSETPISLGDLLADNVDAIYFELYGETIKLNFDDQKIPFMTLMNIFDIEPTDYNGYAPQKLKIHLLTLTSSNHQLFKTIIDYGDGSKKDTVILTNNLNSFVGYEKEHIYSQPGNYTVKVTTTDENGYSYDMDQSFGITSPIKISLPLSKESRITAGKHFNYYPNSVECIYPDAILSYLWDFNYTENSFNVHSTNESPDWKYEINPNEYLDREYVERKIGLIVQLDRDGAIISDTIFQSIKVYNPLYANFTFLPLTKTQIIDVADLPFKITLDASKSKSLNLNELTYNWKINDINYLSDSSLLKFETNNPGKYNISLTVSDGSYSKSKRDSIYFDFNIKYNPNSKISQIEYFFDKDPGFGNGNIVNVENINSVIKSDIKIDCSGLIPGIHRIYFRVKDDLGNWSIPQSQIIIVQQNSTTAGNIIDAEYFFDEDPGHGKGNKLSTTSGNDITINTLENIQDISTGLHRIYFRVKDDLGNWSIPQSQIVIVEKSNSSVSLSKVVFAEYFFDTDPGLGKGYKLEFVPSEELTISTNLPISSLTQGIHNICFRVQDDLGRWSIPVIAQFEVLEDNILTGYNLSATQTDNGFIVYGGHNKMTIIPPTGMTQNYLINVYNLNGVLYSSSTYTGNQQINMKAGVFIIEIKDNSTKTTQKIMVY